MCLTFFPSRSARSMEPSFSFKLPILVRSELPVFLIELKLLGSECAAYGNDVPDVFSIEIGAFDGTIVFFQIAHIGPVNVTGRGVHDDAVGEPSAFTDYCF